MGYAGNNDPQFIIPTALAFRDGQQTSSNVSAKRGIEDLDYFIGDEALANSKTYGISYPIRHGTVDNWDHMEKYHQASLFHKLRCEPEEHHFLLVCENGSC